MKALQYATIVVLSCVLSVAACGDREQTAGDPAAPGAAPTPTATGASSSPGTAFDLQFIDGIAKHHENALTMAKLAAGRAADPKMRELARTMAAEQEKELAQLRSWRQEWFPGAPASDVESGGLDVSQMQTLSGREFDVMFVDMMISHHEKAVTMSCEAHEQSQRQEIRKFARDVIRTQEAQISAMQEWKSAGAAAAN